MNNARRKSLAAISLKVTDLQNRVTELYAPIKELLEDFDDLSNAIDQERSDEEEALENIVGGSDTERGSAMQEAIDKMQEAMDKLSEIKDAFEELDTDAPFVEVAGFLEDAQQ